MIFKMSDIDQTVTVYKLHPETNEFIGSDNAFIPAHTGLPANCTTIKPPLTKDGFVAIFNTEKQKWIAIKDHRGEIVFDTKDARRFVITAPGDYPAGTTTLEPENAWQKWNGSKWEDDAESMRVALTREAELEKIRLLKQAHTAIATLQDAVVLGMASQEETLLLTAWKKYRVLLNRIQVEDAPEIVWPEVPGNVA
ncbi:TPA: tail fiber assembly protein [Escherichia coli]|uniref:tail fiber assembly protein n=4 Tax=Escherichia coli TaxID=562 RepID=UPI000DDE8BDB|nr:tail fiber assembly protein [Escherichia coli]HBN1050532.1 tail fiber assembly protein [Escherichia coli ATCC 8739]EFE1421850.1 tail fiber assembly protein [Escherichia coli]EFE6187501.1 tail fiber assembly protein [Escherichia coli]ELX5202694.1 tail fiber assembly protein [Escherichia coli]MCV8298512.1 tail fiber assembly protein [Escherichia coli]